MAASYVKPGVTSSPNGHFFCKCMHGGKTNVDYHPANVSGQANPPVATVKTRSADHWQNHGQGRICRRMTQAGTPKGLGFMKMHGAGNDFVIIDSRGRDAVVTPALALALGDRNRGVGFDQLAEIRSSDQADFALDFWNNDGTRAEACGNATRCVSDFVMARRVATRSA